jgi:hypothetical protein
MSSTIDINNCGPFSALGTRDLVSDPDVIAILAPVTLFNLDLLPPSLHKFPNERPVRFTIVPVSNVKERDSSKFFLRVTEHLLIGGIGSQESTREVGHRNAHRRILDFLLPATVARLALHVSGSARVSFC